MALKIKGIVQNSTNLKNAIFTAAIKQKVAWQMNPFAGYSYAAKFQVISPGTIHHGLRPLFRT